MILEIKQRNKIFVIAKFCIREVQNLNIMFLSLFKSLERMLINFPPNDHGIAIKFFINITTLVFGKYSTK